MQAIFSNSGFLNLLIVKNFLADGMQKEDTPQTQIVNQTTKTSMFNSLPTGGQLDNSITEIFDEEEDMDDISIDPFMSGKK